MNSLEKTFLALQSLPVDIRDDEGCFDERGSASILMTFSDGTVFRCNFWRLIKDKRHYFSSFDHDQRYGASIPFDAKKELCSELQGKRSISIVLDQETGDLLFCFAENLKLQVFNFTAYEVWGIHFSNGAHEYSNYNK